MDDERTFPDSPKTRGAFLPNYNEQIRHTFEQLAVSNNYKHASLWIGTQAGILPLFGDEQMSFIKPPAAPHCAYCGTRTGGLPNCVNCGAPV